MYPAVQCIKSKQSNSFQHSDQTGWAFKQHHPTLTGLFGVSGFEHVLSDPPPLAVAWPPASHAAPDDYAECLSPSDAQLEISTNKNPKKISLLNVMVWTRWSKWEGDSRLERKTVFCRVLSLTSLQVGKPEIEIMLAAWDCLTWTLRRLHIRLLPKPSLRILITYRFVGIYS